MSGPAILKLSAWEARKLQEKITILIFRLIGSHIFLKVQLGNIRKERTENGKKTLKNTVLFDLSRRTMGIFFSVCQYLSRNDLVSVV